MSFWKDINYIKVEKGYFLEDVPDLYQALYTLFKTKKGQRLFRPTYGADLSRYLFEPCDDITARSMMYDITNSLEQEPRVNLVASESTVEPDPENHRFIVVLTLEIPALKNTKKVINFTYDQKG